MNAPIMNKNGAKYDSSNTAFVAICITNFTFIFALLAWILIFDSNKADKELLKEFKENK